MKISHRWLESFLEKPLDLEALVKRLTQIGLEVVTVEAYAHPLQSIVVACIKRIRPHSNADSLQVCEVDIGEEKLVQVVCGAKNIFEGMYAPFAKLGGYVGDMEIKPIKLRGIDSNGMLCSAQELGIKDETQGILEIERYVPAGTNLIDYLQLDDHILEIELTPNRADCLSIAGIAREVSVLEEQSLKPTQYTPPPVQHDEQIKIDVGDGRHCPRYLACIVKDLDSSVNTPLWMREKLNRCGIAPVSAIVDIMNYVMLTLGQPMHAFDLDKLSGSIHVRMAQAGETLQLLGGKTVELLDKTLLIADDDAPIAMAGIIGGAQSAVGAETTTIVIECAYFSPSAINGVAKRYGLHTEASHRFERGVDFELQEQAIYYACELLTRICAGRCGEVAKTVMQQNLPQRTEVSLDYSNIEKHLGVKVNRSQVAQILKLLNIKAKSKSGGWLCQAPSYRFDISIEEDLIEEVGRFYQYDKIQGKHSIALSLKKHCAKRNAQQYLRHWMKLLAAQGYYEVVTYSFSNPAWFGDTTQCLHLDNPISPQLSVMRSSLFPSLLQTLTYNLNRQQKRIKVFEVGRCYSIEDGNIQQPLVLAGLCYGSALQQQWGERTRLVDFHDLKNDVNNILQSLRQSISFVEIDEHPFLHPQSCASIKVNNQTVGCMGMLHPRYEALFEITQPVWLFELQLAQLEPVDSARLQYQSFSPYPFIRRDISLIIDKNISVANLLDTIENMQIEHCHKISILDVYNGKGIEEGKKSIMLEILFQAQERTLSNDEVGEKIEQIIKVLQDRGAHIKGRES